MDQDKPSVTEFLATLGDTADAVAESLRKLGIKGVLRNSTRCPIAYAVRQHTSAWASVGVTAGGRVLYCDWQISDPVTPEAVQAFVVAFDRGEYPDLEK